MRRLLALVSALIVLLTGTAACSRGSGPSADPGTRWVLVSNIGHAPDVNEPAYVWVPEDQIPTSVRTMLFGKKAVIAPPHVVPRYAPPPGSGIISPLQGGPYSAGQPAPAQTDARTAPTPVSTAAPVGAAATSVTASALTLRGYVVHVIDTKRLVIDLSVQHGLKRGDIVRVTRDKFPIVHPITGAYLGELDEQVATAQIIELREKFAIAEIRELRPGGEVKIRDRVVPGL